MNMMNGKRILLVGILIIIIAAVSFLYRSISNASSKTVSATLISNQEISAGFMRADGVKPWSFPQDFGPHPEFQTEWWYYTGNLESQDGRHFGYQLTFFRRALTPAKERLERKSVWASDQVYMAHFAISDSISGSHYAFERFSRAGADLAGAKADPYQVWLENWSVRQIDPNQYKLVAQQDGVTIDLILKDEKGPILHGDSGYSRKGPQAGNASYYFSQTRLISEGKIGISAEDFHVNGLSWMDHEFSSNALSAGQIGWDWFSIQLDEGSELMVFQIRHSDGSIDEHSSGTLINPDGSTQSLVLDNFTIRSQDKWRSPDTGADYPVAWDIEIPDMDLRLSLKAKLLNQELDFSYAYWEGAVVVSGMYKDKEVQGVGFVEMTGYAGSMEGEF
jgi:predicted secreted hydrolase